jgi:hypothetical protein
VLPKGFRGSRAKLAAFLARETRAGRMDVPDPVEAADFFTGAVLGGRQLEVLLGLPSELTPENIQRIAHEAARRFMRAYAA